jgi:hypothetical protein
MDAVLEGVAAQLDSVPQKLRRIVQIRQSRELILKRIEKLRSHKGRSIYSMKGEMREKSPKLGSKEKLRFHQPRYYNKSNQKEVYSKIS